MRHVSTLEKPYDFISASRFVSFLVATNNLKHIDTPVYVTPLWVTVLALLNVEVFQY